MAFLAAAAAGGAAPPPPEPAWPTGTVVERVVCRDDPAQSYALFLPPGYETAGVPAPGHGTAGVLPPGHGTPVAKRWPILYLFDARARGAKAARLFAGAAGEQGFILASSNNTQSDGAVDPNVTALRALWRDTHARFAIDDRRVYAGGFSGGARVATLMATAAPGTVAGVIGCGAGFHRPIREKPPFVYFGAVGDRDFNFDEMREVDGALARLGAPHHVEVFAGEHGWPPPEVCAAALEWMQLQAQISGTKPADPELAARLRDWFAARAAALEANGRTIAAIVEYERAIADLRGVTDVAKLEASLAALAASPAGRRARKEEEKRIAEDDAFRGRLTGVWAQIKSGDPLPLARLVDELEIPRLRARASTVPPSEDALAADRLLAEIFVQTGFYLPRGYRGEKNYPRAILCVSVAAEARPDSPYPRYERAALEALSGQGERAIEDLEGAVSRGYADGDELARDDDFASLRGSERFRALVDRLKASPPLLPAS
jgi:predicted esterase